MLFSGMRDAEFAEAYKRDIRQIDGVWCLVIDREHRLLDNETIKNDESIRKAPLHRAVLEAGFLEYVRDLPDGPLFPQLDPDRDGRRRADASRKLGVWRRESAGITDRRKVNHSHRHSVETLMCAAGIRERTAFAVTGHTPQSSATNTSIRPSRCSNRRSRKSPYHGSRRRLLLRPICRSRPYLIRPGRFQTPAFLRHTRHPPGRSSPPDLRTASRCRSAFPPRLSSHVDFAYEERRHLAGARMAAKSNRTSASGRRTNAQLEAELKRVAAERDEAIAQQIATAEVLQVINSSPGDLAPVFEAMLEKAIRLCEAAFGSLWTYDGEVFHSVATRNVPAELVDFVRRPYPAGPTTPLGRVARTRGIVSISDLATDEASQSGDETDRQWLAGPIELGGARSYLAVPLMKDDALVGAFALSRREIRPFSEKQIALVQNFAQQAVIAMENARLLSELRQRTEEVAGLNRGLEARVAEQVEELGRVGRLKRFLAPQLAEMIVSQGDENILESHRREIVVVFCDLRGYTAFTETAEPEEVLEFLREYHGALGPLVSQYEGTLDQFSGDGIMVFFNDPVPIPDPAERAIHMAMAMREAASGLIAGWRERGRGLGFGAGIAQGYATLGQIGFSERSGYTAIGTVCNVAARLCAEAKDGQILLSQRVNAALKGSVATEQVGDLALKGLTQPVTTYNVPLTANHPALRVIEGGPVGV
jgi:class 3 adenylate cyclase